MLLVFAALGVATFEAKMLDEKATLHKKRAQSVLRLIKTRSEFQW